nr:YMR326C [Saccharomyces cerevisiae]
MHGTCLSGLYPVPFTHKAHDYPHFNIYISFSGPKYCITALNTCVIPLLHHILTTQCITLMLILQKIQHQNHLNIKIIIFQLYKINILTCGHYPLNSIPYTVT